MENFEFSYPTKVYFGKGAVDTAFSKEMPKIGKTVMLAYGGGSVKKNGVYDEIRGILEKAGKEIVDLGGITPNPKYTKVQEGAALAREKNVDLIVAVGGGSVIDACKVISAQAKLDEDIFEFEKVRNGFPTAGIPMGAVVTASGTGAEVRYPAAELRGI